MSLLAMTGRPRHLFPKRKRLAMHWIIWRKSVIVGGLESRENPLDLLIILIPSMKK